MGRHCPAGGHGQGSVHGWKKRRPGGPPSPLYLCSLKSSPSCIPKEKEKGAEPHPPPPRSGRGGPPAPLLPSPVATRGFQPLSTGSLSSPPGLVQSSEGFSSQPASPSGKEISSPLSTPAPVSTPGLWLGRGEPGEAGASSPHPPGVAPPNLGTGRLPGQSTPRWGPRPAPAAAPTCWRRVPRSRDPGSRLRVRPARVRGALLPCASPGPWRARGGRAGRTRGR